MNKCTYSCILILAWRALALPASAALPWWDQFPRMVETESAGLSLSQNADIAINSVAKDPGWGTYGLIATQSPLTLINFRSVGIKSLGYFETFGQAYCFIAELGNKGTMEYTPLKAHHWNWQNYAGGPIAWVSYANFFDDAEFARPYTRSHPTYGGPVMTYPDGTPAAGYKGDASDPRNNRAIDASAAKDIWGGITFTPEYNAAVNALNPSTGQPNGPLNGLIQVGGQYSGLLVFSKDPCCPMWIDYTRASAQLAASKGIDGMWTDNFSPWDSFGQPPIGSAFGDWTVAEFRTYLTNHFSPAELQGMGIPDAAQFDIRQALRQQIKNWGGNDANLNDLRWRDGRWRDHLLWRVFSIFRRQQGTDALSEYYYAAKHGASLGGKPEFLVAGNDIPGYSLGWPRGDLDMVSTELAPGWNLSSGPRGFMIPPLGRFGPFYKLSREHAKSRFVGIWMYMDGFNNYRQNPGMINTLCYEMLSNHALPKFHLLDDPTQHNLGESATNAAFFSYVKSVSDDYGDRIPYAEAGIFYSSSSILSTVAPGGFVNHASQQHQFDFWGWGTALEELHIGYRAVPEWKLTPEALSDLKLLIVPSADVLEASLVETVITPWVKQGGRLIVTSNSGERLGESDWFEKEPGGLLFKNLTGVASLASAPSQKLVQVENGKVLYIREAIGNTFYQQETQRDALLPVFRGYLDLASPEEGLNACLAEPPASVSVNFYRNPARDRLFIDLCNHSLDAASDRMQPSPAFNASIKKPDWLKGSNLFYRVFSPGNEPGEPQILPQNEDEIQVSIPELNHYLSILVMKENDGTVSDWKAYH